MPTFLEALVNEVAAAHAAGFDEKARQSLQHGVEAVHALSILHRLGSVRDEVRNPSAFVEKSCRTAKTNGTPGSGEIDNALQRLAQSGILDDNVCDMLRKGSVQDAAGALAALMGQEMSAVRNTSAYVTRNMMNAKKGIGGSGGGGGGGGGCGVGGGGGGGCGGGGGYGGQAVIGSSAGGCHGGAPMRPAPAAVGMSVMDLFARWQASLDPKAVDALNQVGTCAAGEVLMELERQGGSVRNPSAYVSKACENRLRDVGMMPAMPFQVAGSQGSSQLPPAPRAPPMPPAGGGDGGSDLASLLSRHRSSLDEEAVGALQKLSPENAAHILDNLKPSVRKPSAYVVRSVGNLLKDGQGGVPNPAAFNAAAAGGSYGTAIAGSYGGGASGGYGSAVGGYASSGGGGFGGWGDAAFPASLDEKARQTLRDLPPAMADSILAELQTKGAEIKNPSAYVSRAAANAREGKGHAATAGGFGGPPPPPLAPPMGPIGSRGVKREAPPPPPQMGRLSEQLDQRALEALEGLPAEMAGAITHALDEQSGRIQNASAWVIKAVGNARKGQPPREMDGGGGGYGGGGGGGGDPAVMDFLLGPWRSSLDEKALQMLEEVGFQAAEHIVNELQAKRDQIRNMSAYVSKAVANFRAGQPPPGGGASYSGGYGASADEDAELRLQLGEELAQLGHVTLDEKAMSALEDVGPRAALSIIRSLAQQGAKVNNPNAYVMKSCANERQPKRQRMM